MISIVVAMTEEKVIGMAGGIPWHIPEDLRLFKKRTIGHSVIMGRITFQSLEKPLEGRLNIVISSTLEKKTEDNVVICPTFEEAIAAAEQESKEIFIIGGAEVYRKALPIADSMYISLIKGRYRGDTYFPSFDGREWKKVGSEAHTGFELITYSRNR